MMRIGVSPIVILFIPAFVMTICGGCNKHLEQIPNGFEIHPEFNMKLVASEPLIKDPVDLEFDERGIAYVLEMPGYPYEDQESRILILKDQDGDGTYDNSIVFSENLELASSIMHYQQGVLVAAPPYLLFLKDEDGDFQADVRDTIMSGFSTGNLQHNYNGLTYGIDNWIYAANGGNSGKPYWWGDTTSVMDLRGDDFRFDLESRVMERLGASSGGYELGIDEYGRIYETHNLEHVSQLIFPGRYLGNAKISPPNSLSNISDHEENGLARIYPVGEQESRVNHPEQSGYFSGACGITYYGGGSFGPSFDQTIWVADVVLNLIHVDRLVPNGSAFMATRVIENQDFLASVDRSFRPVNMTTGPGGSMYIVDMYRQVIEHPEWIPDDIEKSIDLNAGKDKGRIYKVDYDWPGKQFDAGQFSSVQKRISSLGHDNQWIRLTAHRLLLEQRLSTTDIEELIATATGDNLFARLHAMWILAANKSLSSELILDRLRDTHHGIRENALLVAESYIDENDGLLKECINRLTDENQRVRMQAGLTLSTLGTQTSEKNKAEITKGIIEASRMEMDQWNIAALTLAAKNFTGDIFIRLITEEQLTVKKELLSSLARISAQSPSLIKKILGSLSTQPKDDALKISIVKAISEKIPSDLDGQDLRASIVQLEEGANRGLIAALARLRKKLSLPLSPSFYTFSQEALNQVKDRSLPDEVRLEQMSLIDLLPYPSKSEILFSLLSNKESLSLQEDALRQLWESSAPEIGKQLVAKWPELGPRSRRTASDILLYKQTHHDALLTGLEDGTINIGEMNFDLERRRTLLRWTDNEETKRRAEALFSDSGVVNRKDAIEEMKHALTLSGSPIDGSEIFDQLCAQCHIYGTSGTDAGPVLTEINRKSKEALLYDILDPNAAVDTKYINHKLETLEGILHVGMVEAETDSDITIKKMGGSSVTIAKENIKQFSSLGTSMMLEGLEANMSQQDMADLLAYLQQGG